jgi:hypothetical protein
MGAPMNPWDMSAIEFVPITPNDGADLAQEIVAFTINGGGTVCGDFPHVDGRARKNNVTSNALPAGTYCCRMVRIRNTGTSATGITGWVAKR